jgi:hypothetical protein
LLTIGCRSKIDGSIAKRRLNERSAAIDISPGFEGQRQYFQSRSIIALDINDQQIADGDTFSVVNVSNGATLIPSQEFQPNQALLTGTGYSLGVEGYEIAVRIYPQSSDMLGKLEYGKNLLRLEVASEAGDKAWEKEIVLEDFPMFGLNRATFSQDTEILDGFEGSFTGIVRPVVTAKNGNVLRTGFFHIIND